MPIPKKSKFTPIPQEEDSDIELEDTSQYRSHSKYSGWLYFGLFALISILAVWIASIVILSEYGKNAGTKTTPVPGGLDKRYVDLLIDIRKDEECYNSLTIDPLSICENECEKEFCVNEYSPKDGEPCRGKCYPLDTTLEKCKAGCVCCEALTQCLFDNNNDKTTCYENLTGECQLDGSIPTTEYINPICGPIQSLNYCKNAGTGFNIPISC